MFKYTRSFQSLRVPTNPRTARPEVHSDFQHFDERASQGKTALVSMIAIEPDKKKIKATQDSFFGKPKERGGWRGRKNTRWEQKIM